MTLISPLLALKPTNTAAPPSDSVGRTVMNTAPTSWIGKSEASLPLASLCLPTGPTVAACLTLRSPRTRMALVTAHSSSTTPPLPTGTLAIATTIACMALALICAHKACANPPAAPKTRTTTLLSSGPLPTSPSFTPTPPAPRPPRGLPLPSATLSPPRSVPSSVRPPRAGLDGPLNTAPSSTVPSKAPKGLRKGDLDTNRSLQVDQVRGPL